MQNVCKSLCVHECALLKVSCLACTFPVLPFLRKVRFCCRWPLPWSGGSSCTWRGRSSSDNKPWPLGVEDFGSHETEPLGIRSVLHTTQCFRTTLSLRGWGLVKRALRGEEKLGQGYRWLDRPRGLSMSPVNNQMQKYVGNFERKPSQFFHEGVRYHFLWGFIWWDLWSISWASNNLFNVRATRTRMLPRLLL